MCSLSVISCLIFITPCAAADDERKPNTLTSQEIRDGWILLFDGENAAGSSLRGRLEVKNAVFCVEGKKARAVRFRGQRALFNGIDLSGWRIRPGKKSNFTVTVEDGAIQVANGRGALETESKFRDFILQLECRTNGKRLNSGVFFRCKPGEYQNGYEAQIYNVFTAEPTQTYTIEEYDPVTHQLIDKKKVNSQAVDYGTGAIYRRQPARRGVAKDGEWFTMTILARGNHFATWVNGIQVTDWTDNRPPNENPRIGFRREAGHISLQGHDPTTNLSFRNIRIAELPAD